MPNWSLIEMTWRQWKGQALDWWDRLTADEWDEIDGDRERLIERLQNKYGWTREETSAEVDSRFKEFGASLD